MQDAMGLRVLSRQLPVASSEPESGSEPQLQSQSALERGFPVQGSRCILHLFLISRAAGIDIPYELAPGGTLEYF
jgi:hypothetical protein